MSPQTNMRKTLIRYSPRPLATYRTTGRAADYGPATSAILVQPGAWNLAYLSFDYEQSLQPLDPHFTVNVRRTVKSKLDGSGIDMAGTEHPSLLVESLLALPAPRFVHLIERHPIVHSLPMYLAYGDAWLRTIRTRSFLCQADESPPDNVVDFALASAVLAKFCK